MWHTRDEVVRRTIAEFERLDGLLAGLSEADWARPVARPEGKDAWTVKDTVAHVTYWKMNTLRRLRKEPRPRDERGRQIDDLNHVVYAQWRDLPGRDVLAWHRQIQADLVAALREAPEEYFGGREHNEDWPYDLEGHSVFHRTRDIEHSLRTISPGLRTPSAKAGPA